MYDFFGLVDTHIAHLPAAAGGAPGLPGHEKEDFRFLFSKKPTYIIFTRLLAREPPPFPDYRAFSPASTPGDGRARGSDETERWMSAFLREHYDLKCVRLADRENNEEGYFAFLELKRQRRQPGVGAEPRSGPGE
ncbi:MAG: hypothetical protein HY770_06470 [Chitinivibrionia bacterium]|nr:hypothetical protein [Chitinivibrionia bacterium]